MRDPLDRLRAPKPTPEDELCTCPGKPPWVLMQALGDNPIHCLRCNMEIAPENLGLDVSLVDAVASWRDVYHAMDLLWLDSGHYEDWARREMADLNSVVNKRGRDLRSRLDTIHRCYYHWFQDSDRPDYQPPRVCPICGQVFEGYNRSSLFERLLCDSCSLALYTG